MSAINHMFGSLIYTFNLDANFQDQKVSTSKLCSLKDNSFELFKTLDEIITKILRGRSLAAAFLLQTPQHGYYKPI